MLGNSSLLTAVDRDAYALRGRLMALPCVCKRWARILGQPCAAWEHAKIELDKLYEREWPQDADYDRPLDARVVSAWFSR